MSLIAHTFLPRSMYDMDSWFRPTYLGLGPSTLDMFDPFDDLDREMSRNLMWLDRPSMLNFMPAARPKVPKKFRVKLDCRGYSADSIKTEIKDGKLVVAASEGNAAASAGDDFSVRQFQKTYALPEGAEADKMVSFLTSNGQLVVELPIKETEAAAAAARSSGEALFPQIVDGDNGQKRVQMKLGLPKNVDPAKISVTCKDRDLIVKLEDKEDAPDHYSQVSYYQRTTLPENTDFSALKCTFDNNQLSINAPLRPEALEDRNRAIPIEFKSGQSGESK